MKKVIFLFTLVLGIIGCDKNSSDTPIIKYKVSFEVDGPKEVIEFQEVLKGEKATKPKDPTKDYHLFKGWLLNGKVFDFNTPIEGDITLKADMQEKKIIAWKDVSNNIHEKEIGDVVTFGSGFSGTDTSPNTSVKEILFMHSGINNLGNYAFSSCTSLSSIILPNSITSIGENAFYNCTSLATITFSNHLTSIGSNAFEQCRSLTSILLPSTVSSIGNQTFSGCNSLTTITIPSSITSIGVAAFAYCTNLVNIYTDNISKLDAVMKVNNSGYSSKIKVKQ